jgi:ubiquinone/menaquinone biosynthesis C-methylase UbiE
MKDEINLKDKVCNANIEAFEKLQNYDKISYSDVVHKKLIKTIDNAIHDRDGLNILDIGCGTGSETEIFYDKTKTSRIYGVDISKKMLDLFRKRILLILYLFLVHYIIFMIIWMLSIIQLKN